MLTSVPLALVQFVSTTKRDPKGMTSFFRRIARLPTRQKIAWAMTLVLPIPFSLISNHYPVLHPIAYTPHFLLLIVVALLGGPGQAFVEVALTLFSHNFLVSGNIFLFAHADRPRSYTMVISAILLSLLSRSRRLASERLEATAAALKDSTEALVDSLHSSRCACWVLDLESGSSARWYDGSYPIFGRPFTELEKLSSLTELLHPDDQPRMPALVQQMQTTWDPILFEYRAPWPNGELHWMEMRGNRVPGKPCVWRGVTLDITERKHAEAALLRSEKLAAMGRLASTVAHEINNPLESVTNLLYIVRQDPTLSPPTQEHLDIAERELARLGNITRLTLGFARQGPALGEVDVAAVADDVLAIFRHRYAMKNIHVERRYQPGVHIAIAPHELRQILTNLIANAVDAIVHPGATVAVSVHREAGDAILCVDDEGSGIDHAHLPRIFDPFFTTKEDVGTGIGLWVTKELVERNGGRISVHSDDLPEGIKTRFRLQFPLATPALTPALAGPSTAARHV